MILVETTVVIDYVRGKDTKLCALLQAVGAGVCGVVRAELLCGARDPKHRAALQTLLGTFQQVPIADAVWDAVGDTIAALRLQGVTVPFPDAVIATLALELDVEVWSTDPHFPLMQRRLPKLKLFQPPP